MRKSSAFVPHDLPAPVKGAPGGPLSGLNAAVKDMYDIAGQRTGGGSPEWLANGTAAAKHAAPVQKLLDAGADIIGKTVCDEFFFSLSGANAHYGTPANMRAAGRMPGGSSSGSAAAVGAGACDLALGSDTGGSMRVPASFCGVYGIRPTMGRVAMGGTMAMAPSFDVPGWFAGSAGVFRKAGAVLLDGNGAPAPVTRLVLFRDCFAQADAPVAAALRAFLARAADVLPKSEEADVAPEGFADWREIFRTIQGREVWDIYGAWMEKHRPNLGPGIKQRIAYAATIPEAAASKARDALATARAHIRALIPSGTLACIPTAPCIAPRLDATPESLEGFRASAMALTAIAGLSGLPQVSIPASTVDGCPIGLSLIGWPGADETLLDTAVTLAPYCGDDAR